MSWTNSSSIARLITNDDLSKVVENEWQGQTSPFLRLKDEGRRHFDGFAVSITNEKWHARWKSMCSISTENMLDGLEEDEEDRTRKEKELEEKAERWRAAPTFLVEECNLIGLEETDHVTGIASDWLELDSPDDWVRHDCEIALKQELAYASYLGLSYVILPPPVERAHAASYGRAVRACLESSPYMQLTVRLPLYDPDLLSNKRKSSLDAIPPMSPAFPPPPSPGISTGTISPTIDLRRNVSVQASVGELSSTWEAWDTIRTVCSYNPRLTLALDLTMPLPNTQGILSRWYAEPVSYIFLPASTFIPNAKGYPVLPKGTQIFLQNMMRVHPCIILSGTGEKLHAKGTEDKYVDYIRYLEKSSLHNKRAQEADTIENYAQGYHDYLQMPLQPLQDHLASMVYENFERDPVKYQKYEEAVFKALSDMPEDQRMYIAGAGRGPLVARSLRAVERASREVLIYAIEKNPSAYVTLQNRLQTEWGDKVKVLFGDMRHLEVPEKADILVSELLGSFGDNELSPECLDGAMRFLKDDGISIPSSYAAYLAPIQSAKLHHEAGGSRDSKDKDKERGLETPYVVMLQSINFLGGDKSGPEHGGRCGGRIQQCWEFEHPRRETVVDERGLPLTNSHNARYASLTYSIPYAGILHGFAGYFEAVLYDGIGLSIHPDRKDAISKDMLSWFPCFFPIKEPLYLPSNAELRVDLWRLTGGGKVWYEWFAESFLPVSVPSAPPPSPLPSQSQTCQPGSGGMAAVPSTPRVNGAGALVATPGPLSSSPGPARSPLLDAVDLSFGGRPGTPDSSGFGSGFGLGPRLVREECPAGVVKIGQTSLHNPSGRSSFYGL